MSKVIRFLKAEDGPTTVEYAILLALMVGMMIASLWYLREQADGLSSDVVNELGSSLE